MDTLQDAQPISQERAWHRPNLAQPVPNPLIRTSNVQTPEDTAPTDSHRTPPMQTAEPAGAPLAPPPKPNVIHFYENGDSCTMLVAQEEDTLYASLQQITGYYELEHWNFVLSREGTALIAAVYCNEVGRYASPLNLTVSQALGVEVFGKVVIACFEEHHGDEDGEGQWSAVISHNTLLEKLAERGEALPVYHDKRLRGRVGDLMHEIRKILSRRGSKH